VTPTAQRPEPPYRRIAAELRARILAGELRPGERLPSIRQLAQRWGVAIATATKVMAALRDDGLVAARVGAGTVVSAPPGHRRPAVPARHRPAATRRLRREQVLRTAIGIADDEGLDAVSMRRLAAELGVGPMSLYRHVATKDELVAGMADDIFGRAELPVPGPDGWRARLDLVARQHWELCRRHFWLPRAVSFTRPLLVPGMMAHTEWTLRALDGLGLPVETRLHEALTLHALVLTTALARADELEAEQETGLTLPRWWQTHRQRTDDLLTTGRFPVLATLPADAVSDLDALFEYGLARHLDGFAALLARVP
jgi:DNA-binding transcriptional regulator YhcF (GntR family)